MADESHDSTGDGGERRSLWKRLLRWAFRGAALVLILLLLLLHLCPYLTDTGLVRGLVADALSERLSGAHVRIGGLRVAPVRGRLALMEDFAIAPPGQPGSPVVSVERVRVQWRPGALLDGVVHITGISAQDVSVRVRRDEAGWNVLAIMPESEEPLRLEDLRLPLPIVVDAIRARGVRIRVGAPGVLEAGVEDLLADGSCRLRGLLEGEGRLVLKAKGVGGRAGRVECELADGFRVAMGYRNTGGAASVSTIFEAPRLRGASPGLVDFGPVPVRAGFGGELDLRQLALPRADAFVSVPDLLDGRATLSFTGGPDHRIEMRSLLLADMGAALSRARLELPVRVSIEGTASAGTELTGNVQLRPVLEGALRLNNEVLVTGVTGGVRLAETSGAEAKASDCSATIAHEAQIHLGSALGGLTCVDGTVQVSRLQGNLGEVLAFVGEGLGADLRGEVTLPCAASAQVAGSLSADALSVRREARGELSAPAEAHFRLRGFDLTRAARRALVLTEARARAGELAPWMWLSGEADAGPGTISARGGGVLDVAQALRAAEGLSDDLTRGIGTLRAAGAVGGILDVAGHLPGDEEAGLRCEAQGAAELGPLALERDALRVGLRAARSLASLGVSLDAALQPFDLAAAGMLTLGGLEATTGHGGSVDGAPGVGLERLEASSDLRALHSGSAQLEARAAAATEGLRLALAQGAEGAQWLGPFSVQGVGSLTSVPFAGDLTLSDARARVEGLGALHVPELHLTGMGADGVAGSIRLEVPDLGAAAELAARCLPPELAERVPEMAGQTEAEASFSGALPLVDRTIASLARGEGPRYRLFPLVEFYRESVPLDVGASLAVHDLAVAGRLAGRQMGARGVSSSADLRLSDGDIDLAAELGIELIEPGALPVPLRDFTLGAEIGVRDFDALEVSQFRLAGPGEALQATGSLSARGLGSIGGVPTPGRILEGLDLAVDSDVSLRLGELHVLEGLETEGEVGFTFAGTLERAEAINLRAEPRARNVGVRFRDLFSVAGVGGSAAFSKSWEILRDGPQPAALSRVLVQPAERPSEPGLREVIEDFATAVDELTGPGRELELESASGLGVRLLRSLSVALDARGASVEVPRFYLRPLGGKMVGRMSFTPRPEGRELRLRSEFTNVDFREMLPPELRDFRGDAQVSGSVVFAAVLSEEAATGGNPLQDVSARVDITEMGAEALERLLLALDPKGERPAFVRLRQALRLAGPRKVELRLERGFVSIDVELQGLARGLFGRYSLPRFNVSRLFASGPARAAFERLAPLLRLLDVLGAEAIEVSPDGSARFVRRR